MSGYRDNLQYALDRIDVARGYDDYIPTEEESEYDAPEKEKFNRVLDDIERAIKMHKTSVESDEEQSETNK